MSTNEVATPAVWYAPDITPDIPFGTERSFIVAVKRARNGKAYSFPALYLNAYQLHYEYGCSKCESEGDCPMAEGDGCPTTGWYQSEANDDGDGSLYTALHLDPGDELLGWTYVPKWEHRIGGRP